MIAAPAIGSVVEMRIGPPPPRRFEARPGAQE